MDEAYDIEEKTLIRNFPLPKYNSVNGGKPWENAGIEYKIKNTGPLQEEEQKKQQQFHKLAFISELGASAVVAVLTWGIGVGGLALVAWEVNGIALSGIERIYLLLAAPFFLGIMSYFLVKWSRGYKGPGELMAVLKEKSAEFPGWIRATMTWVIACIELGTGLSPKGFEGPYLTTAGGLSGWFASKLSLDHEARRRLARCGLGVAFGVLFRTPLGGFICTFEFGGFERAAFRKQLLPAIVATIVSYMLTTRTGLPTPFQVILLPPITTRPQLLFLLLFLLVVGFSCGIAALCYVFAIRIAKRTFKRLSKHTPLVVIPVLGAAVSTLLGGLFPIILGVNDLSRVLSSSPTIPLVLFGAIVAKIVATAAADGSHCAGGTVGPAILLGGLVGKLVGGLNPLFAAAGSAALIGPIAGLPFTMFLTVVTWLGFTPVAWFIIVPVLLSQTVCWGIELYKAPDSYSLMQFSRDQLRSLIGLVTQFSRDQLRSLIGLWLHWKVALQNASWYKYPVMLLASKVLLTITLVLPSSYYILINTLSGYTVKCDNSAHGSGQLCYWVPAPYIIPNWTLVVICILPSYLFFCALAVLVAYVTTDKKK